MLRVEDLRVGSANAALTFEVPGGRCVGVLGRDAVYLHQLSECLTGLRAPAGGRALVDEFDTIRDRDQARTRLSVCVPRAVDRVTTIGEHVGTIAAARRSLRASVAESLSRLGLDPRQRLTTGAARSAAALIGALIAETSAIVLHEPFTALDESTREKAIVWIRALADAPVSIVILSAAERDVRSVSHHVIDAGAGR